MWPSKPCYPEPTVRGDWPCRADPVPVDLGTFPNLRPVFLWSQIKFKLPTEAPSCPLVSASSGSPSLGTVIPASFPHLEVVAVMSRYQGLPVFQAPLSEPTGRAHTNVDFWLAGSAARIVLESSLFPPLHGGIFKKMKRH